MSQVTPFIVIGPKWKENEDQNANSNLAKRFWKFYSHQNETGKSLGVEGKNIHKTCKIKSPFEIRTLQ